MDVREQQIMDRVLEALARALKGRGTWHQQASLGNLFEKPGRVYLTHEPAGVPLADKVLVLEFDVWDGREVEVETRRAGEANNAYERSHATLEPLEAGGEALDAFVTCLLWDVLALADYPAGSILAGDPATLHMGSDCYPLTVQRTTADPVSLTRDTYTPAEGHDYCGTQRYTYAPTPAGGVEHATRRRGKHRHRWAQAGGDATVSMVWRRAYSDPHR